MNRRSMTVMSAIVVGMLVGLAPAHAAEPEPGVSPQVSTAPDGSVTYRDPALVDEDTQTVKGVLREVVGEGSQEHAPIITTTDGDVIPVDLGTEVAQSDVPVTAQLVEGPALDGALDGTGAGPVEVASARIGTAAAAAAVTTHRAYVAVVTNSGSGGLDSSPVLESGVDKGLAYWTTQSDGAIAGFTRPAATVRYASTELTAAERCGFTNAGALWNQAATKFPGVNFNASGNHLVVVVSSTCSGTGLGTVGSSIASGGYVTMIQLPSVFPMTISHELGHNFGLAHANACTGSCTTTAEYWNLFSVMGLAISGGTAYLPPSLDTVYRKQLGLTASGETAVVSPGQRVTKTLAPRGSTSGLRGLQVKVGALSYWVEWRNGAGRDSSSFYAAANGANVNGRTFPDGVTVTSQKTGSRYSTALRTKSSGAGSFQAGQSFSVGSLGIKVQSIGSSAVVTVANTGTITGKTPTIVGVRKVGRTLRAERGTWSPTPTFSYQWYADGKAISKATGSTIKLGKAQKGKKISVWVTGRKTNYTTLKKGSARTGKIS